MKRSVSFHHEIFGFILLGSSIVAACGGSSAPAESPPADVETASAEAAEPSDAATESAAGSTKSFDEMTLDERKKLMKNVVVPEMGAAMHAFDPEEFADVSCKTCHGPGAKNGDFEMPTKSLPALDEEEMEEHSEMTQFMMETMVPKMAAILGEEPYNPETHEGFGCFHCHTKKE